VTNALGIKGATYVNTTYEHFRLMKRGAVSVLRRYARTYPEHTSFGQGFLGWTLRLLERPAVSEGGKDA
jgi:hypothetical protein